MAKLSYIQIESGDQKGRWSCLCMWHLILKYVSNVSPVLYTRVSDVRQAKDPSRLVQLYSGTLIVKFKNGFKYQMYQVSG